MDLLKLLSETPGAPGREDRVRNLIRDKVEPFVDRVEIDPLGNLICLKAATRPGEKPPKTTECTAPMRAQANMA